MRKYPTKLFFVALILVVIPLLIFSLSGSLKSVWADESEGLTVTPTSLTFTAHAGGAAPAAKNVSVTSSGSARHFTVTTSAAWLTATPTSGTTPATVRVSANPAHLTAGTYTGTVRISVPDSENARQVSVTFKVTSGSAHLTVTPNTLGFSHQMGGTVLASQNLSVRSSTGSAVKFTASVTSGSGWLSASPASGTTPGAVTVSVHPGSLAVGTHTGAVAISSSIGSVTVTVTLTVTSAAAMTVTPGSLAFGFQQGGSPPASQNLSVSSTSAVSFTATASTTSGGSWLTVSSTGGTTPATLTVTATPGNLAVGTYSGSIVVTSSLGSVTVPVTLTVTAATGGGGGGYVLLAWAELGMHCMDGQDYSVLSVLPPYNTIYAKLYTTGSTPTEVTSGVTLTYTALKDASGSINTTSAGSGSIPQKTNFWTYVKALIGMTASPDVGLHGFPVQSLTPASVDYGSMFLDANLNLFKPKFHE